MPLDRPSPSLHLPPARPSAPPSAHRAPPPSQTRLRPGTRAQHAFPPSDPFAPPRPLSDFDESPFAVREYVVALVRRDAGDLDALVRVPGGGRARAACEGEEEEEGEDEVRVEEQVFVLEHVRRLTLDQHVWLAALQEVCTPETCPSMTTSPSWLFVCAAHSTAPDPPCSALSYMLHTSSGASALLTSPRYFPSSLSVSPQGSKLLLAVSRRLFRAFAHCHAAHGDVFARLEDETGLVRRFAALSERFGLVDEAEGEVIPGFVGGGFSHGEEEDELDDDEGGIRAVDEPHGSESP